MQKGKLKGDFIIIELPIIYTEEWIDTKSGVRYIHKTGGGLAPRLNADGSPMVATQAEMDEMLRVRKKGE